MQHVDVRAPRDFPGSLSEPEHALEGRQFPVDRRVRGAVLLAVPHVGEHPVGRDGAHPAVAPEERPQMVDGVLDAIR